MRRALISGCSSGIGKAITVALLEDGWHVTGVSRSEPSVRHPSFCWIRCNVAVGAHVDRIGEYLDYGSGLDALITCAATQRPVGTIRRSDPLEWSNAIGINLMGTYRMVRFALPYLERSEDARVLLFSGGGAFSPRPGYSAYSASKAGIVALGECLAGELPVNVTVNTVAPGFVQTPIHAPTLAAGLSIAGAREYGYALRPDNGEMENVVACVRHLLSPSAHGVSGRTISVPHDDWASISPTTAPVLMASPAGTRTRHKIAQLAAIAEHHKEPNHANR